MSGPGIHDDTTDDHERVYRERFAQDWDARRPSTADLDDETAREVVRELLDAEPVTPVVGQRVFVHEPSGAAFESMWQLTAFHWGWTAAVEAGETEP